MRTLRDSMTVIIQRHAEVLNDILRRASESGDTLDLFRLLNRFTIEAFAEIGFGEHMGCLDSDEAHPFQRAFDRAQLELTLRFVRPIWFWKIQRWLGVGAEGQLKRDIDVIDAMVLGIVDKLLAERSRSSLREGEGKDEIHTKVKILVSLFLGSGDFNVTA
ncbi:unnamed protein product [Phytophthora lilii]|uniref:Unnamed protein product n=1 Tax=Phytophthora lilii TaxID=2077276 RepID=A0A9W6WZS7_9STRA|nr:unnamed protein product [Phytophthora lilii]